MRIEYDENGRSIVGWCKLPGFNYEMDVIAFSNIHGVWIVSASRCLPSNFEAAEEVHRCVSAAFAKVNELKGKDNDTVG